MATIEVTGVHKKFGSVSALDGVDLTVESGENLVVLGPSGSGKSTLLRTIAGLEFPDTGQVRIGGADQGTLPPHRRNVAIVFQHFALYPHLSALTNITLGLRHGLRMSKPAAEVRAREVADRLAISELLERLPRQMSGGQRQRVALARALARQAGVVLLDEPLSGLDAQLRVALRMEIANIMRSTGATTLHVTHDQLDAMATADRIAVVRAGRVEQIGTPEELYDTPATVFVAGFIGSPPMNLIPVTQSDSPFGEFRATEHESLTLGIRPEHLVLSTEGPWTTSATVAFVESAGPSRIVHADLAGHPIAVRCDAAVQVSAGEIVPLSCRPDHVRVFGPDGRHVGPILEKVAATS